MRFGVGSVLDRLEHEELQQGVVLCATLEGKWWERPLKNYALNGVQVSGAVSGEAIEDINWLVSSKLYQGVYVVDKALEENGSSFTNMIRDWFPDAELARRRSNLSSWRDRLVNGFLGDGSAGLNGTLKRLAGREGSHGSYIGFVPRKELDYLCSCATVGTVLMEQGLAFSLESPGHIGIVDPAGRHLGTFVVDEGGGEQSIVELAEIPGGDYSGPASHPREIRVPKLIPGNYEVKLHGTGAGAYTLRVKHMSEGLPVSEVVRTGTFQPDRAEDAVISADVSESGAAVQVAVEPTPRGSITGTVTDAATGLPLASVRVAAGDSSDITTADGTFVLSNVLPGSVRVSGSLAGYDSHLSEEITLAPGDALVHDIGLVKQPVTLEEYVFVSLGTPVYDRATGETSYDATVLNVSSVNVVSPLWLVIDNVSDPAVSLAVADGVTPDGRPYVDLSPLLSEGILPGGANVTKRVRFVNPERLRFTFETRVLGFAEQLE